MADREFNTVEGEHFHSDIARDVDLDAHIDNTSDPHNVNKSQVGLGDVENTALSSWKGSLNLDTLAPTGVTPGSYTLTSIQVTADGRIISISSGSIDTYSQLLITDDNYTILDDDEYTDLEFDTGNGDRICQLPYVANNLGRTIYISKVDGGSGKVSVVCEGYDDTISDIFIDESTTINLINQGETLAIRGSSYGWKMF